MEKTILVVDDFASIRLFICSMLSRKGYNTIEAASGNEAFHILTESQTKIDLVLTDYNMPNSSGYDLLQRIKRHPFVNAIPVIFMTTESDPEKIREAVNGGVAGWIRKPYRSEIFFTKIEHVLNQKS
jgi:two-component system, chemotaxis family, chemotaxis protein CheY